MRKPQCTTFESLFDEKGKPSSSAAYFGTLTRFRPAGGSWAGCGALRPQWFRTGPLSGNHVITLPDAVRACPPILRRHGKGLRTQLCVPVVHGSGSASRLSLPPSHSSWMGTLCRRCPCGAPAKAGISQAYCPPALSPNYINM